ncbi:DCC1-like thiol-disulfide oxidoreductase family protein [Pararoseomonas sp. SCSIO 73927]|uniref:thiol-disulfide oxidoreductase DCC family protein n=1 Tax=Pararoseomonas sp. SCSIO 73927 TaxID=3114537 RepID=UPI0030D47E04
MTGTQFAAGASPCDDEDGFRSPIILFDTDCLLCSGMLAFVLAHERDHLLRFAGAWSPEGLALAGRHGFGRAELHETFLVIRRGRPLTRSAGVLEILRHLKAPWSWLGGLRAVPRPLRDAAYSALARRRYDWFGRRENCAVVPQAQRHRFIGVRPGIAAHAS